jgi:hypothetical protein
MAITRTGRSTLRSFDKFNNAKTDIAAGIGIFWATTHTGEILTSADGLVWVNRGVTSGAASGVCVYADGYYWAGNAYSADGVTWTLSNGYNRFRNVSGTARKSDDGFFQEIYPGTAVGFAKDRLVNAASTTAVPGSNGERFIVRDASAPFMRSTSDNGRTWIDNNQARITAAPGWVVATPSYFYANNNNTGDMCFSTTGEVWTPCLSGSYNVPGTPIRFVNGVYLVGSTGTNVFTSTNGTSFTTRSIPNAHGEFTYDFTFGKGLWVYAGGSRIHTSTDTITWSGQTSGTTNRIYSVNFF